MNTTYKLIASMVIIVLLGASVSSWIEPALQQNVIATPVPKVNVPPPQAYKQIGDELNFALPSENDPAENLSVSMTFSSLYKVVSARFTFHDKAPGGEYFKAEVQKVDFPTSYYPTGITFLGGRKIAVSGVDSKSGLALIEIWTLKLPSIFRVVNPSGEIQYFMRPSSIEAVSVGFSPAAGSHFGIIRAMWANRALGAGHILVLSYPYGNLYDLDLATKAATLVQSSTQAVSGRVAVPELSSDWEGYFGPWRHSQLGDVYILTNDSDIASPPDEASYLFIWDHNKDGIAETSELLSRNEQIARGLNLGSAWDRIWPN
jgi:hypothetical protein